MRTSLFFVWSSIVIVLASVCFRITHDKPQVAGVEQTAAIHTMTVRDADINTNRYENQELRFVFERTALILVDVWDDMRFNQITTSKIVPLAQVVRESGMQVVHATYDLNLYHAHTAVIDPYDMHRTDSGLFDTLKERGISTLIFAGYCSNLCMLNRPVSILEAHAQGFRTIVVRDASAGCEDFRATAEENHEAILRILEMNNIATTVMVDDVIMSLRRKP